MSAKELAYPMNTSDTATDDQKAATRRYVEQVIDDTEARMEILQMLGLESYERTITESRHGRTRVVKVTV